MLLKKSAALLSTYGTLNAVPSGCISSTSSSRARKSTRQTQCAGTGARSWGSMTGGGEGRGAHHRGEGEGTAAWPMPLKGQSHPTPYQIFAMKSNAVYSKTRYYELVKLYHPDRAGGASNDLSPSIRLERYRLIVAAHAILSDSAKRSAYDRFGAGWNGKAEVGGTTNSGSPHAAGPFSQSWGDPADPIWRNATWEDWQKYYEWRARRDGTGAPSARPKQEPVYIQNSSFVLLIAVLALIGSTMNSKRAHEAGAYFIAQRDIVHDRTAKELRKVRQDATTSGSRQDRIDWFIRNREATLGLSGSDSEVLQQEKIDRLLPERETCNGEAGGEEG